MYRLISLVGRQYQDTNLLFSHWGALKGILNKFLAGFTRITCRNLRTMCVVLGSASLALLCLLTFFQTLSAMTSAPDALTVIACDYPETLVLAEYQGWHGLPSHQQPPLYHSQDREVIVTHIETAKERCIDGFVLDWYGRLDALAKNIEDRKFMDEVLHILLDEAAQRNFSIAILYDEGTLKYLLDTAVIENEVAADLIYAKSYFTHPGYLHMDGKPTLFVFPYPDFEPKFNWEAIRNQIGHDVTLLDQDPDPSDWAHDRHFDGFYAWVKATDGKWGKSEWGEGYLRKFYATMKTPLYADKITVGGVWSGFDDAKAPWAPKEARLMSRECGGTWLKTWGLVDEYKPPIVMIATWNDFEEGTDVERGIVQLHTTNNGPTVKGQSVQFQANFSDCTEGELRWDFGDGTQGAGTDPVHTYTTEGVYPVQATGTYKEISLAAVTTVIISSVAWYEDFAELNATQWITYNAEWIDIAGPTASLHETGSNVAGKAETIPLTINIDSYRYLRVNVLHIAEGAAYTIQLLDKDPNCILQNGDIAAHCIKDVRKDIAQPGEQIIDLTKEAGWSGMKTFTINVWIVGDGKQITFGHLSIEHDGEASHLESVDLSAVRDSIFADGVSTETITATVMNNLGDPSPNTTVTFTTTIGTITPVAVTNLQGQAVVTLTSALTTGTALVTAVADTLSDTVQITFTGGSIVGEIFEDVNRNGVKDVEEKGVPNARVTAKAEPESLGISRTVESDQSGVYRIPDLPLGKYNVTTVPPSGYTTTTASLIEIEVGGGSYVPIGIAPVLVLYLPVIIND